MSIKDDIGLLRKYDEITDSLSMTIKIRHDQVDEIVVAALMGVNTRHAYPEKISIVNLLRMFLGFILMKMSLMK